jgi:putative endonuclease
LKTATISALFRNYLGIHPVRYVYVLRSFKDKQFYVGFTKNLPARVKAHNDGLVPSTKSRLPLQLVYWEGCLNQTDATHREKYLKTAWEAVCEDEA